MYAVSFGHVSSMEIIHLFHKICYYFHINEEQNILICEKRQTIIQKLGIPVRLFLFQINVYLNFLFIK